MAGRQGHERKIRRVPRRHDDSSIFRIVLDLVNTVGQLINALSSVVRVHVHVVRSKVAPLKAVHGSKVANLAMRQAALVEKLARTIAVPNVYILFRKIVGIGVSLLWLMERYSV